MIHAFKKLFLAYFFPYILFELHCVYANIVLLGNTFKVSIYFIGHNAVRKHTLKDKQKGMAYYYNTIILFNR